MFGEPVVRIRREVTGEDRYGNPIYSDVETTLADGAAFDPGGSHEPVEVGRTQTVTTPKLYFTTGSVDLNSTDRVRVRGEVFTVQGAPAVWVSPFGSSLGGTVAELQRVQG